MKNFKSIWILLMLYSLFAHSQQKQLGTQFINALFSERNYEEAYSYFDENTKNNISLAFLIETDQKIEQQVGKFKAIIEVNSLNSTQFYYSEFEKMKLDIKIIFDDKNKISSFNIVPHKEIKPDDTTLGINLNIKSSQIELKGTLLQPKENDLRKLVVFIHGTGPQDRDETIYENKPFKDIAEGLYKKGISSYRFDKRTFTYPGILDEQSTIDDEVTLDVLSVVDYFHDNQEFKDYSIILLGHSFGAYLLPRIANKTNKVDKIIIMAGNARPLDVLIADQCDYLYKLNPDEESKKELLRTKDEVKKLRSKDFKLHPSLENLPLGLSYSYWNSLFKYDPLKDVKKLKIPLLIQQGERDYQVTMKEFVLWKRALENNKKATFISYPKLNHLFISGEKFSEPEEYAIKGNVDSKVIEDICTFLN